MSATDHAVAVWPDSRNATGGTQQDLYAAEVRFADTDGTSGRPLLPFAGGAALVAAGGLVVLLLRCRQARPVAG